MNPPIAAPSAPPTPPSETRSCTRYLCAIAWLVVSVSAFGQRILPDDTERSYEVGVRQKLDQQAKKIWKLKEDKSDDKSFYTSAPFMKLEKDYRAANQQYMHFVAYDDRKKLHLDVALAVVDADIEDAKVDPREPKAVPANAKAAVVDPTADPK